MQTLDICILGRRRENMFVISPTVFRTAATFFAVFFRRQFPFLFSIHLACHVMSCRDHETIKIFGERRGSRKQNVPFIDKISERIKSTHRFASGFYIFLDICINVHFTNINISSLFCDTSIVILFCPSQNVSVSIHAVPAF